MVEWLAGLLGSLPCARSSLQGLGSRPGWLCAGELSLSARPPLPSAEACVHLPGLLSSQGQEDLIASGTVCLPVPRSNACPHHLCVTL